MAVAFARQLLMRAAGRLLGPRQAAWAQAMQAEVGAAQSEREALAFAWGCFCAALGHALAAARVGMNAHNAGVLTCTATVLLGCAFMLSAGAPGHYVVMNGLSLAFALATFRLMPRARLQADELLRARLSCAMGALLLVAGLHHVSTGAAAWLRVGPVPLNMAWLLLPALLVASDVRSKSAARRWAFGGLVMACAALALMADVLLLGLAASVLSLRALQYRHGHLALLALAAWAMTVRLGPAWQAPEALAFVDGVVHAGFAQSWAIGAALALLQILPLWPALRHRAAGSHGWVWGLLVALSLPGWLPSPLVGFGGSFILGYLLSLAFLPGDTAEHPAGGVWPACGQRVSKVNTTHRTGPARA